MRPDQWQDLNDQLKNVNGELNVVIVQILCSLSEALSKCSMLQSTLLVRTGANAVSYN